MPDGFVVPVIRTTIGAHIEERHLRHDHDDSRKRSKQLATAEAKWLRISLILNRCRVREKDENLYKKVSRLRTAHENDLCL